MHTQKLLFTSLAGPAAISLRRCLTILLLGLLLAPELTVAEDDIRIVGLFRNRAIVQFNGQQKVLRQGEVSPEGLLLISANSQQATIEYLGNRRTYDLGSQINSEFSGPEGRKSVMIAPDSLGMYMVNGSINGFQVRFMVDTGATLITMNGNQARRFGIDYRLQGVQTYSNTASGRVMVYMVNLDRVMVGDLELARVPAAVHDGDYPEVILLGNSFLNQVDMQREGRLLKLQQLY